MSDVTLNLRPLTRPGSASIPIGAVIDWWRPNSTFAVPDGYMICDGSVVNDAQSPFNGEKLPELRGRFIRGAGSESVIGKTGGADRHKHTISGSTDSKVVTMHWSNSNMWVGIPGLPPWEVANKTHEHTTDAHSHGVGSLKNSTQGHEPPYVQLLKIMRIR